MTTCEQAVKWPNLLKWQHITTTQFNFSGRSMKVWIWRSLSVVKQLASYEQHLHHVCHLRMYRPQKPDLGWPRVLAPVFRKHAEKTSDDIMFQHKGKVSQLLSDRHENRKVFCIWAAHYLFFFIHFTRSTTVSRWQTLLHCPLFLYLYYLLLLYFFHNPQVRLFACIPTFVCD